MRLVDHPQGHYRFLTGIAPYSSGVIAMPGYEIVRARLAAPLPYRQGFELIDRHLDGCGRPPQALCAVELRIPEPLTFDGFAAFNADYQELLARKGLLVEGLNPIARTNVAPAVAPPEEAVLYAFSYTVPNPETRPTFVVAGAGDLRDQADLSPAAIVRPGDTTPAGLRAKATCVMEVMAARLQGLGLAWADVTAVDVYTVHSLSPLLVDVLLAPMGPAARHGVHWFYSRPPISGLDFEMDLRGVAREILVTP
uniref:RidA family protein n=1 Tax=Litorilinea aerophila TaxID=1204385 RepID=A0A540VCH0_9CHLR